MKKFVKIMAFSLALVTVCLFAISCSVKGNTYEYEKYEIVGEDKLTAGQKLIVDAAALATETFGKGLKYTFNSDGTLGKDGKGGYWKQDGSKVYSSSKIDFNIKEEGYLIGELKGGKLVISHKEGDFSFNIILKKV